MGRYSWIKGLVTLNAGMPSVEEAKALNINVVMPFGWSGNQDDILKLAKSGIKIIPNSSQMGHLGIRITPEFEKKYNVMAWFITDEPEFSKDPQVIIDRAKRLRTQTNLPITCNFTNVFHLNEPWMTGRWGDRYKEVFAQLDFISIDVYFFRGGKILQIEIDRTEDALNKIRAEGKECLALAQGHQFSKLNITQPDIAWTNNWWRAKGCGVLWYAWNGYDVSIGDRGGQNEWYNKEIAKVTGGHWPPVTTVATQPIPAPTPIIPPIIEPVIEPVIVKKPVEKPTLISAATSETILIPVSAPTLTPIIKPVTVRKPEEPILLGTAVSTKESILSGNWWKENAPWVASGVLGLFLIGILARK